MVLHGSGLVVFLPLLVYLNYVDSAIIKITNVTECDPKANYSVTVTNLDVIEEHGTIFVSGSLTAKKDLMGPINADLSVKRYVDYWGVNVWVKVLCVDSIGSCSYSDLCHYGIPQNHSCPKEFVDNSVPCRCPILEGNYTMNPQQKIKLGPVPNKINIISPMYRRPVHLSTLLTGIYYVTASVNDKSGPLACYNVYFRYDDEEQHQEEELTNEISFVHLIR